ncbi:unnamed protein product, partial [marine sediment metagenome]
MDNKKTEDLKIKLAKFANLNIKHDFIPCGVAGIKECRNCG